MLVKGATGTLNLLPRRFCVLWYGIHVHNANGNILPTEEEEQAKLSIIFYIQEQN